MFRQACSLHLSAFVLVTACGFAHADEAEDLLPFVPADANAIAVMRIDDLKNTPRGQAENWAEQHETEFLNGAANVPPWVTTLVRASYVRPGTRGGDWTAVVLPLPGEYDMRVLADREVSEVQEMDGRPAVFSARNNGYFIELTPAGGDSRVLGGIMPATRQDAARWADDAAQSNGRPTLSPYLNACASDANAQIVMAFDMEHMLDPTQIRYRLDGAEALQGKDRERAGLTILLQTIKGVKFDVHVDESMTAEIHMEFGRNVGPEGQFIKSLLIEFMHDAGAVLDEIYDADVDVSGRQVTLSMPLSDESLRRVLTLITTPPPPSEPRVAETPAIPEAPEDDSRVDVNRSRRYWDAVNRNIDDLKRAYGRASSYARTAQWHENFAQRIDHLSTRNVDADLVAYGQWVADSLRGLSSSLRGTALEVNTLQKTIVYNVEQEPTYWRGPWGGVWDSGAYTAWGRYPYGRQPRVNVTSNLQEVREKQAESVMRTAPEREQIWQMIDQERSATERMLVGRYGDDFGR